MVDTTEDISGISLLVIVLVLSIATTITVLRIYTRIFLIKQLGWDDYCVVATLMFAIGTGATVLSAIPHGLGRHTSTLSGEDIVQYLFGFWLSIVLYNITLTLIKLTFVLQYYRVLAVHKMKRVIWVVGAIIMAWAVSQIFLVIFPCRPVQKFWQTDLPGSCMPNQPFWYINAAGNIATDLAIFIMPLPVLSKLQLRRKQKYFLMGIFSLGFFTCAISLIRLTYLKESDDFTYTNVQSSAWSTSELCCGISCACLPTLKPLVSKIKPRWITSYVRSRANRTETGLRYGKSGLEGGTELKHGTHRSRATYESATSKTMSSLKSKTYAMMDDLDADLDEEQGVPTRRQPEITHYAPANTSPKQPMPAGGLQRDSKAMEVLGMSMTGVSTHVSSGTHSHPDSLSPSNLPGESLSGIAVKRSVTVEMIPVTPKTPHGIRRTNPREF